MNTPQNPPDASERQKFRDSSQWRALRYDCLTLSEGRCCLCGRTAHDGTTLQVDHVVPITVDWSKRMERDNLQVLCKDCNEGKSNRDATDWRAKSSASAVGSQFDEHIGRMGDNWLSALRYWTSEIRTAKGYQNRVATALRKARKSISEGGLDPRIVEIAMDFMERGDDGRMVDSYCLQLKLVFAALGGTRHG